MQQRTMQRTTWRRTGVAALGITGLIALSGCWDDGGDGEAPAPDEVTPVPTQPGPVMPDGEMGDGDMDDGDMDDGDMDDGDMDDGEGGENVVPPGEDAVPPQEGQPQGAAVGSASGSDDPADTSVLLSALSFAR